jgi:transcriptional regulator with XRE-family HTH domain
MSMVKAYVSNYQLKKARWLRGWSQRELADRLGTTVVTIKRWERGSQQPRPYFRLQLCMLFSMSAEELGLEPLFFQEDLRKN